MRWCRDCGWPRPRDAATLAEEFAEALQVDDGPTVLRYPKGPAPAAIPALRRVGPIDVLAEPPADADRDVLLVAVGAFAGIGVEVADRLADQGIGVTVVDPRWVLPVPAELGELATGHRLVVTVEDGGRSGGVGAAIATRCARRPCRSGSSRCRRSSCRPAAAPSCWWNSV